MCRILTCESAIAVGLIQIAREDVVDRFAGVCASDLHTLRSGWGETDYPVCVGHEIVGQAVRVGSKVPKELNIKVGDRVGKLSPSVR